MNTTTETDQAYYTYVTLHLLEVNGFFTDDETCDERWSNATAHYQQFLDSKYNDHNESEYSCIEAYIESLWPIT